MDKKMFIVIIFLILFSALSLYGLIVIYPSIYERIDFQEKSINQMSRHIKNMESRLLYVEYPKVIGVRRERPMPYHEVVKKRTATLQRAANRVLVEIDKRKEIKNEQRDGERKL